MVQELETPGTSNFSKLEKLEMFNLKKIKCKRT